MRRLDVHMRECDAYHTVEKAVRAADPIDFYVTQPEQRDRRVITVILEDGSGQALMDNLQNALEDESDWRVTLLPIEATAPKLKKSSKENPKNSAPKQALREELYQDIAADAKLDRDFMILVALSTIVAAIGLHSDAIAAVIGAMVIAPLLGPILGFSFGAALGDRDMLIGSGKTLAVGLVIALISSVAISFLIDVDLSSRELISRAEVRLDGVALAIAAGMAAALSMARGKGSTLVGVMVAAALLPPGAAVGLFLGAGEFEYASRATLLLALNVASLVFAALVVFRLRRIRPRSWLEKRDADWASAINLGVSVAVLIACVVLILMLDLGAKISIGG